MHLKYTIMYDYAVGIACSAVVVLFTTIIQYSREHSKKLKEFNNIIFPILTSMCLLEDENDVLLKKRLDVFLSYFDSYNKYISKLFWFDAEKDSVYIKLIIEMTKVFVNIHSNDFDEADIIRSINEEKIAINCIGYMAELIGDKKGNVYYELLSLKEDET